MDWSSLIGTGVGTGAGWLLGGPVGGQIGGTLGGALGAAFDSKKNKPETSFIYGGAPKYEGRSPFGSPISQADYSSLGNQYLQQIMERSKGEGMVGFDPRYSQLAKQGIEADLGEQRRRDTEQLQGQASSQGLRGGIPMTIGERYASDFQRNRQNALNQVDLADLQARREDINKATYAQPEFTSQANQAQNQASLFDLGKAEFELPREYGLMEQPDDNGLGSLAAALMQSYGAGTTSAPETILDSLIRARTAPVAASPDFTAAMKQALNYRRPY